MKQSFRLIALLIIFLIVLSGCSKVDNGNESNPSDGQDSNVLIGDNSSNNINEITEVEFKAEVIEVGDSLLITPDKDSTEYKSSDKMSVSLVDTKILNKDGSEIALKDLKPGDIIEITYNGVILESYPAQITASAIEVVDHNILIDGYLALIDDIYQEDSALNADIEMISLDTTGWIDVTDIEKEIIFTKMKEIYGVDIIQGTFDELAEQGIIDKENLLYPKGVHITISDMKYNAKKETITCSLEKWRSGLGAIGSNDVTAKYKDGVWKITKENMWVS